jgi:hypothetical protein
VGVGGDVIDFAWDKIPPKSAQGAHAEHVHQFLFFVDEGDVVKIVFGHAGPRRGPRCRLGGAPPGSSDMKSRIGRVQSMFLLMIFWETSDSVNMPTTRFFSEITRCTRICSPASNRRPVSPKCGGGLDQPGIDHFPDLLVLEPTRAAGARPAASRSLPTAKKPALSSKACWAKAWSRTKPAPRALWSVKYWPNRRSERFASFTSPCWSTVGRAGPCSSPRARAAWTSRSWPSPRRTGSSGWTSTPSAGLRPFRPGTSPSPSASRGICCRPRSLSFKTSSKCF